MKTTFYIMLTFFGLQSNLFFADNTNAQAIYSSLYSYPTEAYSSDNDLMPLCAPAFNMLSTLAPVTPAEADFNDSDSNTLDLLIPELAPKTPGEADFLDTDTTISGDAGNLAPVIPVEATFDDLA